MRFRIAEKTDEDVRHANGVIYREIHRETHINRESGFADLRQLFSSEISPLGQSYCLLHLRKIGKQVPSMQVNSVRGLQTLANHVQERGTCINYTLHLNNNTLRYLNLTSTLLLSLPTRANFYKKCCQIIRIINGPF